MINSIGSLSRIFQKLLQYDIPYVFNAECQQAFKALKNTLISPPIVRAPDWTKQLELMSDASDLVKSNEFFI